MKRAVIYMRTVSSSEIVLQAQHDMCLEFCQRYNFAVVGTFVETGQGLTLDDRPKLDELRRMMHLHYVEAVVVYTLGTLAHDYGTLMTLAHEAEVSGVDIHSVMVLTKKELTPMQVDAVLREREQLAMLLRDTHHRERQRWTSAV